MAKYNLLATLIIIFVFGVNKMQELMSNTNLFGWLTLADWKSTVGWTNREMER